MNCKVFSDQLISLIVLCLAQVNEEVSGVEVVRIANDICTQLDSGRT